MRAAAWLACTASVVAAACCSWVAAWQLAYFGFKYLRRRIQPAVMVMPPNSAAANAAEPHEDRCRACPICSLMNVRASRICSGCDAPLSDEIDDSATFATSVAAAERYRLRSDVTLRF